VSAALFFGSLLSVALASPVGAAAVVAYGLGTALPVGVFAIGLAIGAGFVARVVPALQRWQPKLQQGLGWLLLAIGLFLLARDSLCLWGDGPV